MGTVKPDRPDLSVVIPTWNGRDVLDRCLRCVFESRTERSLEVLVVDNRMPGKTGLELIRDLVDNFTEGERPQIILMTAHATVDNAIEAMKLGAFDYLQKPFEVDELLVAVGRALEHQRLRGQHRYLRG